MTVKVEVLYVPTCAAIWLEKIRKVTADFGSNIAIEEIDVSEHPEALKKYPSSGWQEFREGYIHYFIVVAINGKVLDNWYWDTGKVSDAIRRGVELEKAP